MASELIKHNKLLDKWVNRLKGPDTKEHHHKQNMSRYEDSIEAIIALNLVITILSRSVLAALRLDLHKVFEMNEREHDTIQSCKHEDLKHHDKADRVISLNFVRSITPWNFASCPSSIDGLKGIRVNPIQVG